MGGKELLAKYVVVEGHRDVYEQLYRTSVGEKAPIRDTSSSIALPSARKRRSATASRRG
jgi:hypothetical protein